MPRGKRTSLPQAAQAKALADIGYQGTQIADAIGLPVRTVDDIINGRNGWREIIANDKAFKQYRTQAKRQMQAASITLSQKALQQIEDRIDKASAPQAAMVYGILRDKERLDAGEATEIVALHTRQGIEGLDALAAILGQTLLQSGKEIDVTPQGDGTTKVKDPRSA
jgi:hypothetical protein